MSIRTITHRRGFAALAAGVAAVGALALPATPASAADDGNVTVTVRATMRVERFLSYPAVTMGWITPSGAYHPRTNCTRVEVGQTKDIQLTVPKGALVDIRIGDGCPTYVRFGKPVRAVADHDGQLIEAIMVNWVD